MKKPIVLTFMGALLLAGCSDDDSGGGSSIDIVGKSPEAQADLLTSALCRRAAACGSVTIECHTTDTTTDCTWSIDPVSYDTCYADTYSEVYDDLGGCGLTAEQEGIVGDCINATTAQACITQAELDAYVAAIEAGDEDVELRPAPQVCVQADPIFERCDDE
jgi:hypothetical protein